MKCPKGFKNPRLMGIPRTTRPQLSGMPRNPNIPLRTAPSVKEINLHKKL